MNKNRGLSQGGGFTTDYNRKSQVHTNTIAFATEDRRASNKNVSIAYSYISELD